MSISIQKKKLLVVALACAAVTLTMIASWQLLKEVEYYDEDDEDEDEDEDEEEEEDEEEDEFTSEDAHCEDLEDGVEVTSSRRRSNLALEGGDISGGDITVEVIEGSSHQKRDGCTSGSESNLSVRKKPRTGDLVKGRR